VAVGIWIPAAICFSDLKFTAICRTGNAAVRLAFRERIPPFAMSSLDRLLVLPFAPPEKSKGQAEIDQRLAAGGALSERRPHPLPRPAEQIEVSIA